jgi:CheY-like chemotaxis protein
MDLSQPVRSDASSSTVALTILCVDDEAEPCELSELLLSEYKFVRANNAYEALKNINRTPFDCYLLDYWLPDMSGVQLCRDIRKEDPHVPIVFCSAAARDLDRDRAIRAGASAYICKPVNPEALRSKVAALMQLSDRARERALMGARRPLRDELARRAALDPLFLDHAAVAVERVARRKALQAFLEHGGTRAAFERGWGDLWLGERRGVLRSQHDNASESR